MRYEGLRVGTARRRMLHTNAGVGEGNPIEMNQPRERKKREPVCVFSLCMYILCAVGWPSPVAAQTWT